MLVLMWTMAGPEDVVIETNETVATLPLHTQLIRQVAEESKRTVVSIYVKMKTPHRVRLLPIPI